MVDANVVVRAFAGPAGGASAIVGQAILDGRLTIVLSREVDAEFATLALRGTVGHLLREHGRTRQEFQNQVADIRMVAEIVQTTGEAPPCRDPKDRKYLHCVRDGNVPYLVTRDRDLLESTAVPTTRILTPEEFVQELGLA